MDTGSLIGEASQGLESKVAQLLVMAAEIWGSSNIPEEAPTVAWLRQYLEKDVVTGMYKVGAEKRLLGAFNIHCVHSTSEFSGLGQD